MRFPLPLGSAIGGLALCGGGGADPDGPAEDAGLMPDVDVVGLVEGMVMDWDLAGGMWCPMLTWPPNDDDEPKFAPGVTCCDLSLTSTPGVEVVLAGGGMDVRVVRFGLGG